MSLRERVRQLREERCWSQGELADKIGADPAQINCYEHGRIAPSADAIIRFAATFSVSNDHLLIDDARRRPSRSPEDTFGDRLAELDGHHRELILSFIYALITKTRLKTLADGIS